MSELLSQPISKIQDEQIKELRALNQEQRKLVWELEQKALSSSEPTPEVQNDQSLIKEKIEPPEARVFIDEIFSASNSALDFTVIWAGCPGAGGYDDIVVFILGDE